ncbi:MAG: SMP-30/gluconolactonase/LRE family protein [Kordiimonadaceae bacterium]|nr:SMP-30/gluconolactonase/LRE family protein [Kordiimonadaceae bacterium]
MSLPKIVANLKNTLGEGPAWSAREQALYWIDIIEGKLFRFCPIDGCVRSWDLGVKTAVVVPTSGQQMLLACQNYLAVFDPETGTKKQLLNFEGKLPNNRPMTVRLTRTGVFGLAPLIILRKILQVLFIDMTQRKA